MTQAFWVGVIAGLLMAAAIQVGALCGLRGRV
jgi:hypothetical protein